MIEVRKSVSTLSSLLVLLAVFAIPDSAAASTYSVHQCTAQQGSVSDAVVEGTTTGYTANNSCGYAPNDYLQIGTSGPVGAGQSKAWTFTAPYGTKINRATGTYLLQGQADHGGHRPYFLYRGVNQGSDQILGYQGAGNTGGAFDTDVWPIVGAISRVGIGVDCKSAATCPNKSGIYSRIGDLTFSMEDTVAPAAPVLSGPAIGGWFNGTSLLTFSVHDTGAGVYGGSTAVNGTFIDLKSFCSPALEGSGSAKQMQPCPATSSSSSSLDTTGAAFIEGVNTATVCVYEYGEANLQRGCTSETVKVDTIAPTSPQELIVAGGEDWKRDNEFDLSWANPAQPHAPIVGASIRITGPGGHDQTDYHPGSELTSINNIQVPAKGDYTARVFLRDAAGNESVTGGASVHLRFDDTVPKPQEPQRANGWINRTELAAGYLQGWLNVSDELVPPSGITGYRVVVNTNSDTDPCSGAVDPRTCGGPITESGRNNRSRTLRIADLTEGTNYVHVVPISGSGMRATDVRHTPLKVDLTDPVAQLQGNGDGGWVNHGLDLTAVASDALSGMQDTDEYPGDAPPEIFLRFDGQTYSAETGTVSQSLSGEGEHQIDYWARDLAGNTAAPVSATVRIDETAPAVAFTNGQDPEDPDKLVAPVSDALSGVTGGQISYRQADGSGWTALETGLEGGELLARVDSEALMPGTTYEFRVEASDRAGNTTTSTRKQNGEPMRVTGPFRTITRVVDLKVNSKTKARVKYGKKPKVSGELLGADGRGVANASVELVSTYFGGSKKRGDMIAVTTDSSGGFAAVVPRGPGRAIVAEYRGDRRYLGVRSAAVKASIRSKVTLKVPRVVDSDEGIIFAGKVKAKGAKLGKRGMRLEVQVRIGRKWKTVGKSTRTNRRGRYKLRYRFTADYPHAVDYQFRAAVLKERGFPYLPSKSKKRVVTVTS